MKLKVLIRPESVGGYSVSAPALPGCHSHGRCEAFRFDHQSSRMSPSRRRASQARADLAAFILAMPARRSISSLVMAPSANSDQR
jgi:hypothetical protein